MGIIFNRIDEKLDAQRRAGNEYSNATDAWCDCGADPKCSRSEYIAAHAMVRAALDTFFEVCAAKVLNWMPNKYK